MAEPFATEDDLTAWLGTDAPPPGAARLLRRASEHVADACLAGIPVLLVPGYPYHDPIIRALRDATCAQVEQWLEVGEDNALAGYPTGTTLGSDGESRPVVAKVAPRAVAALRRAGLTRPGPWARAW